MPKKLTIYEYSHSILKARAQNVENVASQELDEIIDDMIFTLNESNGVGLAAPQIGLSKRIIIVASKPNKRYPNAPEMLPEAMINPQILKFSKEKELDWEGCLSVPDSRGLVPRSSQVLVSYQDKDGQHIQKNFEGFIARIIQHEIDHLDGITFVERMEAGTKPVTEKVYWQRINDSN